jgi:hypothetical protein
MKSISYNEHLGKTQTICLHKKTRKVEQNTRYKINNK